MNARTCLLLALAACGSPIEKTDAAPPDARPAPGAVAVTWTITKAGQPSDCASVEAGRVTLRYRLTNGVVEQQQSFLCTTGGGMVMGLAPGSYVVGPRLDGANAGPVLAEVTVPNVTVTSNQTTTLDPIVFAVP